MFLSKINKYIYLSLQVIDLDLQLPNHVIQTGFLPDDCIFVFGVRIKLTFQRLRKKKHKKKTTR